MPRAERTCLDAAEALLEMLRDDESHEARLRAFLASEDALERLDALQRERRADVERLVLAGPKERARLLAKDEHPTLLLTAAIRYCLQAAAILEGFERELANRPVDKTILAAAHRAHDHFYEDRRSLWPFHAGPHLSFRD